MLSQIPGISVKMSRTIMEKFDNLPNLIKELEKNPKALNDIKIENRKLIGVVTMGQNLFRNPDGSVRDILENIEGIVFNENPLDFFIILARYKFGTRFIKKTNNNFLRKLRKTLFLLILGLFLPDFGPTRFFSKIRLHGFLAFINA